MALAANGLNNAKVYRWSFANATARLAEVGFVASDTGGLAIDLDTNTLFMLTDDAPIVWQAQTPTSAPPSGAAGGVLSGTYPNPGFAADMATQAELDANATADRARANHTGSQLAATISDFDTQVRTNRLDQLAAPTAAVSFNGQQVTNVGAPVASCDATNKSYVDALVRGLDWKASVRVATAAAGVLATSFENGDTVDGVVLVTGDRILIKDQAAGAENGVYTVNATGAPTRATDADEAAEVTAGLAIFISEGTANLNTAWVLTTDDPIVLGTTALVFVQLAGGALATHNHTTAGGDGGVLTNDAHDGYSLYDEIAAPATPAAGKVVIYAKADGLFYGKDDAGVETGLSVGGGSGHVIENNGTPLTARSKLNFIPGGSGVTITDNAIGDRSEVNFSALTGGTVSPVIAAAAKIYASRTFV